MAAVRRLGLLGTPAEERFDRITRLARRLFNVPMAVIDIVGENLAWLKSVQGFDGIEGARCDSYCHHTVLEDRIFLVRDARIDPRVHDSHFADTWVFYAGVPLHFEGQRVGVLCVGDTRPGDLDEHGEALLRDLAGMVEQELSVARMSEIQLALARSNEELEMRANVDVLTRIWNRRAILEIAENEHRRVRTSGTMAVLMIDIDHFKNINDTYGHPAGDEVLRAVGERLRSSIRPSDAVGRLGGEEFLVLMIDVQESEVARLSEGIRSSVANEPVRFEDQPISTTCSVGFVLGGTEDSIDALIRRADEALYRAKANGRNRVEAA